VVTIVTMPNIGKTDEVIARTSRPALTTTPQTIGVSQMEKEIESQVESVKKRFKPSERTDEPDLKEGLIITITNG
jgi:hypothetical protein